MGITKRRPMLAGGLLCISRHVIFYNHNLLAKWIVPKALFDKAISETISLLRKNQTAANRIDKIRQFKRNPRSNRLLTFSDVQQKHHDNRDYGAIVKKVKRALHLYVVGRLNLTQSKCWSCAIRAHQPATTVRG